MISQYGFLRALHPVRSLAPLSTAFSVSRHLTTPSENKDGNRDPAQALSSPLQSTVRSLMRLVPHSLTVILSNPPSSPPTGLLVSSFNTVTLHPIPFVSFNIKLPSATHTAIVASGKFSASGINNAELARIFIQPSSPKKSRILKACLENVSEGGRGTMLRDDGQGALWWMHCEWVREMSMQVGDHAIMVGEVVAAGKFGKRNERKGVVYLNGIYKECFNPKGERTYTRARTDSREKETKKRTPYNS